MEHVRLGRTALKVSRLCLGTMNFGPLTSETDSHAIMDAALEAGINFFDTADVYGWKTGEGITEHIVGRWFAERRPTARPRRPGHQGVRPHGRRPKRPWPVRLPHHARLRGQPAAAADRPHRPVPDAPRRSGRAVGRDLAGDGAARPRRQGPVRRQQQLRRLAHRAGQRRRRAAPFHGTGVRTEPLQSERPHGRARGAAGVPGARARRAAVESAGRRAAGRDPEEGQRGPPRLGAHPDTRSRSTARAWRPTKRSAASSASSPPTSAWRGCCTRPPSPRRSSARAPWSN